MAPTASATKKAPAKKAAPKRSTATAKKATASRAKKTEPAVEETPQEEVEVATTEESTVDSVRKDDEPLYNMYRPTQFSEVVGQKASEVLRRSIAEFSVARTYLFAGPRGTGKTTNARLFAAGLLSRTDDNASGEPDLDNPETRRIINGESMFVNEIDCGRNNGVDEMAQVLDNLRVSYSGKHRVVIFDEAHLLTPRAVSSALKSLEEFKNVTFILCTTNPEAFPDTIRSRSIVHHMSLLSEDEIREHIGTVLDKERVRYAELGKDDSVLELDDDQIESITLYANGSARDALSGLQTIISGGELNVYSQGPALVQAILSNDIAESFAQIMEASNEGVAISGIAQQSIAFLNAYLMYCVNQSLVSHRDLAEIERHEVFSEREFKTGDVIRLMRLLVDQRFGQGSDPTRDRQLLELSIVTYSNPDADSIGRQAINRIESIEGLIRDSLKEMEARLEDKIANLPGGTPWPPAQNLLDDESEWSEDESEEEDEEETTEDEEVEQKPKSRRRREIVPQSSDEEPDESDDEAVEASESDQNEEDEESTDEDDSDAPGDDSEPDEDDSDDESEEEGEDDPIVSLLAFVAEEDADLHEVMEEFSDDIRLDDPDDAESPLVIPVIKNLSDEQFDLFVDLVRTFFGDDEMEVNEDVS